MAEGAPQIAGELNLFGLTFTSLRSRCRVSGVMIRSGFELNPVWKRSSCACCKTNSPHPFQSAVADSISGFLGAWLNPSYRWKSRSEYAILDHAVLFRESLLGCFIRVDQLDSASTIRDRTGFESRKVVRLAVAQAALLVGGDRRGSHRGQRFLSLLYISSLMKTAHALALTSAGAR